MKRRRRALSKTPRPQPPVGPCPGAEVAAEYWRSPTAISRDFIRSVLSPVVVCILSFGALNSGFINKRALEVERQKIVMHRTEALVVAYEQRLSLIRERLEMAIEQNESLDCKPSPEIERINKEWEPRIAQQRQRLDTVWKDFDIALESLKYYVSGATFLKLKESQTRLDESGVWSVRQDDYKAKIDLERERFKKILKGIDTDI